MLKLYSAKDVKRGLETIGATYRQLSHLVDQGAIEPTQSIQGRHLYEESCLWMVYLHLRARQLHGWVPYETAAEEGFVDIPVLDDISSVTLQEHGPFKVTADVVACQDEFRKFMLAVQGKQHGK